MSDIFLAKSPFFIIKSPLSVGESPAKPPELRCRTLKVTWSGASKPSPVEKLRKGGNEHKIVRVHVNSCSSQDLSSKAFCMNVLGLCSSGGSKQTEKKNKANEEVAIREYPQHVKIIQHGPLQPAFIHLTI
jgi:hypothetical protein